MQKIYPNKLKVGDEVRVVAPARSLAMIADDIKNIANRRFEEMGLVLSFGKNVNENDAFISSSIKSRIADLHEAFADKNVMALITVIGGFNSNQLLDYIDWGLLKSNPKIMCGFSDITALNNSIYKKTGIVTYSGPHYSTFGQKSYFDYTLEYFKKCLMSDEKFDVIASDNWSDDEWYSDQEKRNPVSSDGCLVLGEGEAGGTIIGGNLCTLNLLQGTQYFPDLKDSVLFIEDDYESTSHTFDRDLQSLIHQSGFDGVKGLVIGRFQNKSKMTKELLSKIVSTKRELKNMPILANVDFGHTDPKITFPVGGEVEIMLTEKKSTIKITKH